MIFFRNSTFLVDRETERKFGKWKTNKDGSILFRCNYRPKGAQSCKASVKKVANSYEIQRDHCPDCKRIPGVYEQLCLMKVAKNVGLNEKDKTAKSIVEPLLYKLFAKKGQNFYQKSKTVAEV